MYIAISDDTSQWKDCTLVVPAVSVGNIGQLAVDVLISSLKMKKTGYFYEESFLPIIGNDPYCMDPKECSLTTSAEIYESPDSKVVCMQQRTPFVKGKRKAFLEKLVKWIEEHQFKKVIILTSSFAQSRMDKQLYGSQQRFLLSPSLDKEAGAVLRDTLKYIDLEKRVEHPGLDIASKLATKEDESAYIYLPGGGIAKQLFENLAAKNVQVAVLLSFVSEGDNSWDGIALASYLNAWQEWFDQKTAIDADGGKSLTQGWDIPPSWNLTFGSSFDPTLY